LPEFAAPDDPPDDSIASHLYRNEGGGEDRRDAVRKELRRQALDDAEKQLGRWVVLIHNGNTDDHYKLGQSIPDEGEIVLHPIHDLEEAQQDGVLGGCEVLIVSDPVERNDLQEYETRLVLILDGELPDWPRDRTLVRPLHSQSNRKTFDFILAQESYGEEEPWSEPVDDHQPPAEEYPAQFRQPSDLLNEEEKSSLMGAVELEPSVEAADDLQPDSLEAVKALLEARLSGTKSSEALRNWVVGDPAFLGWVELSREDGSVSVKAGGRNQGAVLRSIGDEIDIDSPIPTEAGTLGPFIGIPITGSWLGFLARDPQAARREFFRAFRLLPLIDDLIPATTEDGTPVIEAPENRFERLLESRIDAAQKRGAAAPGVLVLEHPDGVQMLTDRITEQLRGCDWVEVADERLWILLDQPEKGTAAPGITRRLLDNVPGIRGGGVIGVSPGQAARECMDRARSLLRDGDQLRIVDEIS